MNELPASAALEGGGGRRGGRRGGGPGGGGSASHMSDEMSPGDRQFSFSESDLNAPRFERMSDGYDDDDERGREEDEGDYAPHNENAWLFTPPPIDNGETFDQNGQDIKTETRKGVRETMVLEEKHFTEISSWGRSAHKGEYCYICEQEKVVDLNGKNEYSDTIEDFMKDITKKSLYFVITSIHDFYHLKIEPRNGKIWSRKAIFNHMFDHIYNPIGLVMENIRMCHRYSRSYEKVADNRAGFPNHNAVKTHVHVMKKMEQSIALMNHLKANPALAGPGR